MASPPCRRRECLGCSGVPDFRNAHDVVQLNGSGKASTPAAPAAPAPSHFPVRQCHPRASCRPRSGPSVNYPAANMNSIECFEPTSGGPWYEAGRGSRAGQQALLLRSMGFPCGLACQMARCCSHALQPADATALLLLNTCGQLAAAATHVLAQRNASGASKRRILFCLLRRDTCVLDLCVPQTTLRRLQQTAGCTYSAQLTCDFTSGKATCDTRGLVKLGEKYTVRRFASRLLSGWPPQRGPRATPWPLTACWATMPSSQPTWVGALLLVCQAAARALPAACAAVGLLYHLQMILHCCALLCHGDACHCPGQYRLTLPSFSLLLSGHGQGN